MEIDELTAVFEELGAPDPHGWARSEVTEGINQLGRYLFLKGAWEHVVDDEDTDWMDRTVQRTSPESDHPFDDVAHGLRRLLANGADKQDLQRVIRGMQVHLLFGLCYLLDDPGVVEGNVYKSWRLFEVDEDGAAGRVIGGLHESVLATDPTGREMRPRPPAA